MRISKRDARIRRHRRVRQIVRGTAKRPRLAVFRSNKHISAQLIDDASGRTLTAVTTRAKDTSGAKNQCNTTNAKRLGEEMGAKMKELGIGQVVFDRSGYLYHGVVKAFADAVRSVDGDNHFGF